MSELETLKAVALGDEVSSGDRLAWVQAGIAALEARLDANDGSARPEERAMLVTLLMSLEDAIRKIDAEPELTAHLHDVGGRVRTRVLSSADRRAAPSPLLRIVPWARSSPATTGPRISLVGRLLTAVGVAVSAFLVFEFALTGLAHDRAQRDLLAAFKQQISTTTLDAPNAAPTEGSPVALLHIGRIGLDQVVVEGTSPEDLKKGPGHLRAAPLPGEFGNAVITGRRTTYGAPFLHLNRLRPGDAIRVSTGQGVFNYVVSAIGFEAAGHAQALTASLDSRLTLVTSDPAFLPSGRLTVIAKLAPTVAAVNDLKGTPLDVARRPSVSASISELGLAGDPLGLVLALIWGQLLIVAVWLTSRVWRRWPMPVTVMFATPTILGLSILAFSSIDRLLPGAL